MQTDPSSLSDRLTLKYKQRGWYALSFLSLLHLHMSLPGAFNIFLLTAPIELKNIVIKFYAKYSKRFFFHLNF